MVLVAPVRSVYPAFGFVFWPIIIAILINFCFSPTFRFILWPIIIAISIGFCFNPAFPIAIIVVILVDFLFCFIAGFRFLLVKSI